MATTYAEVANKLTKKLGKLEETLKTSTEPTEIESAKRMMARVQQALQLLKISQQNHPEAESPEGQGIQQGMEQQMMPQQQGMSPYQTGGYLPSYQASSSTLPYKKFTMGDGTILEIPEDASIDDIKTAYNNAIEVGDSDTEEALRGYIEENNIDIPGIGTTADNIYADPNRPSMSTPDINLSTAGTTNPNNIYTTPTEEYREIGTDEGLTQIPAGTTKEGLYKALEGMPDGPAKDRLIEQYGLDGTTNPNVAAGTGASTGTSGSSQTNYDWNATPPNAYDLAAAEEQAIGEYSTPDDYPANNTTAPPKPNALEPAARSRMQDPALSALGLAPTLGNLYMAAQKRDYYPGFYPKQAPMDFGQTESLLGEARDRMSEGPMYNPRPELVKAEQARKAQMANAQNASGSARFALQNMAEGQKSARTSQILGHAQNVNAQNERAKAQGLMGLAGAYGNLTTQRYGAQQRALDAINAEQRRKWDLDARTDATSRAFAGAGLSQLGQWAQLQQQMGNQYDVDSERSKLLGSMYSNYGYTPQGWEYDPTTGKAIG